MHNARRRVPIPGPIIKRCAQEPVRAAHRAPIVVVPMTLLRKAIGVLAKGRTKPVVERQIAMRESVELRVLQAKKFVLGGISVLKKAVDWMIRIRAALLLTATQSLNATVTPVVLIPIVAEPTPRIIASGRHTIYWSTPTSPYRRLAALRNLAFQTATAMAAKSTARVQ